MIEKPLDVRLKECINIRRQLREHVKDEHECQPLLDAMDHFVRDGISATGTCDVPSIGRKLEYMLSHRHDSYAVIKRRRY